MNCLESIKNQTKQNYEIVIVDDGSTDNSSDICKKFANKNNNVKYIRQSNKGHSLSRIEGIKNAKGKYVAFVDADD